jgi:hypothetical protein
LDDNLADQLHEILQEGTLEWDVNNNYTFDKIEIFALIRKSTDLLDYTEAHKRENSCKRHEHRWVRIGVNTPLRKVVTHPSFEMFGVPLFWVVSKQTDFRKKFLEDSPDRYFL